MNKISTTIEQGRKLIELGIDVNTADMWWQTSNEEGVYEKENPRLFVGSVPKYMMEYLIPIPAWSLSALLELIPNYVINKVDDKIYANLYYGLKTSHDNLVDAAFAMICQLKENNKI